MWMCGTPHTILYVRYIFALPFHISDWLGVCADAAAVVAADISFIHSHFPHECTTTAIISSSCISSSGGGKAVEWKDCKPPVWGRHAIFFDIFLKPSLAWSFGISSGNVCCWELHEILFAIGFNSVSLWRPALDASFIAFSVYKFGFHTSCWRSSVHANSLVSTCFCRFAWDVPSLHFPSSCTPSNPKIVHAFSIATQNIIHFRLQNIVQCLHMHTTQAHIFTTYWKISMLFAGTTQSKQFILFSSSNFPLNEFLWHEHSWLSFERAAGRSFFYSSQFLIAAVLLLRRIRLRSFFRCSTAMNYQIGWKLSGDCTFHRILTTCQPEEREKLIGEFTGERKKGKRAWFFDFQRQRYFLTDSIISHSPIDVLQSVHFFSLSLRWRIACLQVRLNSHLTIFVWAISGFQSQRGENVQWVHTKHQQQFYRTAWIYETFAHHSAEWKNPTN